ncbi:MAG: ATP-binding cassette domain-containing protein [Rickettsiales bacterium]|jgi:D-methionine transport system ATP-binding protein|nr:ATP-binding cassette domain-containing protein [Rickettsiales bacterium]
MIRITNLNKLYNGIQAVNDISLEIPSNTIYGIIGKSGAGKSTLVRLISLLEKPDSGEIYFNDRRVDNLTKKDLLSQRHKIGMIFQNFNLFSSRNVFKNVAYPLEIVGKDKHLIRERVFELLKLVSLEDKIYSPISQLSGGQKQRVAIARALANEPEILFCDEATSALDPQTSKSIIKLIKDIQKQKQLSVIMITHQMEVVRDGCDFVSVMEDGKIVENGSVRDIFLRPQKNITKEFISTLSTENYKKIGDIQTKSKKYRLTFDGGNTDKPIISHIIREYSVDVNILSATINNVNNEYIGETIAEISGEEKNIKLVYTFLRRLKINVEEVR